MTQYAAPDSRPVPAQPRRAGVRRTGWWVPASLVALAAIPVLGGVGRLVELLGGPEVLPTDARFAASPVPLVVHIVAAVGYALLGAFQFSARLRRRRMAPPGGSAAGAARARRCTFRAVDDAAVSAEGGHR